MVNVRDQVPFESVGLAALPSSKVTLWGIGESENTHVTVAPTGTVTFEGLKRKPWTVTFAPA
ncbi:MAG TPA: hypothetical protein VMU14_24810 [Acidimicrobiales bacterium]|nr:hypothetical protein [Acidimicrobiales bacterium]